MSNLRQKIINEFNAKSSAQSLVNNFTDNNLRTILLELESNAGGGGNALDASDLPITFDQTSPRGYGDLDTPLTGTLTFDMTGAVDGGTAVVFYNDSTNPFDPYPTISGQTVTRFGGDNFQANITMKYEIYYDEATSSIVFTEQAQAVSPPTLSSLAVSNSSPGEVDVNMVMSYTYAQAEGVAENTSAAQVEWYQAATTGELDEADIVAGAPTLVKSSTGDFGYTPTTDGIYLRGRIRIFATGSNTGSIWYYTSVIGPTDPSAAFTPLSNTSTVIWYDFTQADGGATNTDPNTWETVYNKVQGLTGGDLNYVQTSAANQGDISNQVAEFHMDGATNTRYDATSWTAVGDTIADEADRTVYALCRFPASVTLTRFMYLGQGRQVWCDTTTGFIQIASGSLKTADGSLVANTWSVIKMRYVNGTVTSSVEILTGAGVGSNEGTQNSSATGIAEAFDGTSNSFDIDHNGAAVEWRHLIVADGTLPSTGTEEADIEAWLAAQAAL